MSKGRGRWGARPRPGLPSEFSATERQLLIGSLLGDGSATMYKRSLFPAFRERHSMRQGEYLKWKGAIISRLQPYIREHRAKIRDTYYPGLFLSTPQIPALTEFMAFYKNGSKVVPNFALTELGPLALAVWLQDDGYLRPSDPGKGLLHPYMEISSQCFSPEDQEQLRDRLWALLQTPTVALVKHPTGTKWQLTLGVKATRSMAELCAPHWHPSMDYKFPYPELLDR